MKSEQQRLDEVRFGRSRETGHPIRPSAEGRSSWLNFLRKILSFPIPNRFYPGTP